MEWYGTLRKCMVTAPLYCYLDCVITCLYLDLEDWHCALSFSNLDEKVHQVTIILALI